MPVCLFKEPGIESPDAELRAGDSGLETLELRERMANQERYIVTFGGDLHQNL
jgi:hypothetical protein